MHSIIMMGIDRAGDSGQEWEEGGEEVNPHAMLEWTINLPGTWFVLIWLWFAGIVVCGLMLTGLVLFSHYALCLIIKAVKK